MATVSYRKNRGWTLDAYDDAGKRIRRACPERIKTKKAAEAYLKEFLEERERTGTYLHVSQTPLFKDVAQAWLDWKETEFIESTTVQFYRGHVENHLNPFFGSMRVKGIQYPAVEKFVSDALKSGKHSQNTVRKIVTTLSAVMDYAERSGYRIGNPVKALPRMRRERLADNAHDKKRYLTKSEIERLLKATGNDLYRMLFFTAVWTGARQGELLALKWSDVDFKRGVLMIRRTFNHGEVRKTKSKTSCRDIPLFSFVVSELREWRMRSKFSKDEDLIFPNGKGNHLCQANMIRRHFHPALKAAEIDHIRFHDLRHTFASHMLDLECPIHKLRDIMGHSSIQLTKDTYGHLVRENERGFMDQLESRITG